MVAGLRANFGSLSQLVVACNGEIRTGIAKVWWWLASVWSEADSRSYRLSEDQARRRQTERYSSDFTVTGH
jgi:hypothetical protein